MSRILSRFVLFCVVWLLSISAMAQGKSTYTYKNKYFSILLPQSVTLKSEFTTPAQFKKVKETVFTLANYSAKEHNLAVSGKLDPQIRAIITLRKGHFDRATGPAVEITLTADSIKQRRGMPTNVKERMHIFHHIKTLQINGITFNTYQLPIKNSPVIYTFYSAVIKDRLVSLIWTAYSKHPSELTYYSNFAKKALASFRFYGYP